MAKITLEQLENLVKRQDLQISNLKSVIQKMQHYVMTVERKTARAAEAARVITEAHQKLVRKLNEDNGHD